MGLAYLKVFRAAPLHGCTSLNMPHVQIKASHKGHKGVSDLMWNNFFACLPLHGVMNWGNAWYVVNEPINITSARGLRFYWAH